MRGSNFTESKKSELVALVTARKNVLECKLTDTVTNRQKNECWQQIEREFNVRCPNEESRTWEQLKQKWMNCKKSVKNKNAETKHNIKGTGGGSYGVPALNGDDQEVFNALGDAATGHENDYDDDGDGGHYDTIEDLIAEEEAETDNYLGVSSQVVNNVPQSGIHKIITPIEIVTNDPSKNFSLVTINSIKGDPIPTTSAKCLKSDYQPKWKDYTPAKLKDSKSLVLRPTAMKDSVPNAKKMRMSVDCWASGKMSLSHSRVEAMKTTSDLRDKWFEICSKNQVDWETKIFEARLKEINERIRREDERHVLEMDILKRRV